MSETLEDRIKADWSKARAFIATHPWVYTVAMVIGGWILGRLHLPF
jgi:hypothetical protein